MPVWKKNLFACWIGVFIAAVGMSEVAPILPLYLHHLTECPDRSNFWT
ncbi:multidrug efflux MFS transporter [Desulfosporosinus sp. FKA]|nr:multidrug efflux MFS transporter [Desulfosporosinus sp. FKA]